MSWRENLKLDMEAIASSSTQAAHLVPCDKVHGRFANWRLSDFLDVFAVNYIRDDNDKLLVTIDAKGNVLLSGKAHFHDLGKLSIFGTRVRYFKECRCFLIATKGSPKMIRAVLANLNRIYDNVYLVLNKVDSWPVRDRVECAITHLGEYTLKDYQREAVSAIVEAFTNGFKSFLLADQDGLDKPLQALAVCKALNKEAVIVTLVKYVSFWANKAQKAGVKAEVYSYTNVNQEINLAGKILILDEAGSLHNMFSNRSKNAQTLIERAEHIIGIDDISPYQIDKFSKVMKALGIIDELSDFRGKFSELKGRHNRYYNVINSSAMWFALDNLYPFLRRLKQEVEKS